MTNTHCLLHMDGTTDLKDSVHDVAATTAGASGFGALVGSSAPKIKTVGGSDFYTDISWSTATLGITAGMALSIILCVNSEWAGNDGTAHNLFDNRAGANANGFYINKSSGNTLTTAVYDAASGTKGTTLAVNGTNWAAGTHWIIMTRTTAGVVAAYLDGVTMPLSGAGTGLESSLNANTHIGVNRDGASFPANALILATIFNLIVSDYAVSNISSRTSWVPNCSWVE